MPNVLDWSWVPGALHYGKDLGGAWAQWEAVLLEIRDIGHRQKRLDWCVESQIFALHGLK